MHIFCSINFGNCASPLLLNITGTSPDCMSFKCNFHVLRWELRSLMRQGCYQLAKGEIKGNVIFKFEDCVARVLSWSPGPRPLLYPYTLFKKWTSDDYNTFIFYVHCCIEAQTWPFLFVQPFTRNASTVE